MDRPHARDVEHELIVVEAAGIELRLAARAERTVQRVLDREFHFVVAVGERGVHVPLAELPPNAIGRGVIRNLGRDDRQKSFGIDFDRVAIIERSTIEARGTRIALLIARPSVHRSAGLEFILRVRKQRRLLELGLAVPRVESIECQLARIECPADERKLLARVPAAALGVLLILVLRCNRERTGVAEGKSFPRRHCERLTIRYVS